MAAIIPELILLQTIKAGFDFIKKDFDDQTAAGTPDNSYLSRILKGTVIERYNYYDQAQSILFKRNDDPRKLNIDLMFNMNFDKVPSIYITLPGEQHGQNVLSVDQSSEPYYNVDQEGNDIGYTNKFSRRKNATYGIYIMSDNSNETSLLYYILDCLLITLTVQLALKGLHNLTQGGQDLNIDNTKIPKTMFTKAISLGMQYERSAPDMSNNPMFTSIIFEGRPIELQE